MEEEKYPDTKLCRCCGEVKPIDSFSIDKRNKSTGRQAKCKDCTKRYHYENQQRILEVKKQYRLVNKVEISTKEAAARLRNPEPYSLYLAAYYKKNKEEIKKHHSEYYQNNKALFFAHGAKRRAAKIKRTPSWLTEEDLIAIEDFYFLAKSLTEVTGIPHVVDHIIPLQGKLVSGFHHPNNLQILTESENASKGNKYNPE